MPYKPLSVKITGDLPQLMHSGRLKNPLDPWAKAIRKHSSKRKKTDEDHIKMMEYEYKGSLYLFEDDPSKVCDGKYPFWPADNIHACIKTMAKDKRLGKKIDEAMVVTPPGGRLIYEGPRTRNELWANERFRLVKGTKRGTMCCRPMFNDWSVEFFLRYLEERIDLEVLQALIVDAGKYVGLSEWPRRYGLFHVDWFKTEEVEIDVTK